MIGIESQLASLSPAKRALLERKLAREKGAQGSRAIGRRAQTDACPLSFAQQRLWLLQEMNPESYFYNVPRALRLRGKLDVSALENALNEIVRRHEVLRTSFPQQGEDPVQFVAPSLPLRLSVEDIAQSDVAQNSVGTQLEHATALADAEYRKPFNLATGPVIRARLWRLAEEDHVLLVVMHHIVSDAWTGSILFEELGVLYDAYRAGRPSPLAELPAQYADYAAWQREYLSGDRLAKELSYWERHLHGAPTVVGLPTDRHRVPTESYAGTVDVVAMPTALAQSAIELSRREGATLFMTLLAVFNLLLSRYVGRNDLVIGTDLANRTQVETEKMIGFFINVLPIRTRIVPGASFRSLLATVKEAALGAYAHQEMPFDKIVEAVKPERTPTQSPLVQLLFVMQNTRARVAKLTGLEVSEFRLPMTTARFELGVFMEETPEALNASWLYSTDLFDRSTILRMAGHYERLLSEAVENPDKPVAELAMLSVEEERERQAAGDRAKKMKSRKLMATVPEAVRIAPRLSLVE